MAQAQRMTDEQAAKELARLLGDWHWRLNNLYKVKNENGQVVTFKMNWAQQRLYDEMHYSNVVLKARQLGMTTFIQIFMLDAALFNPNVSCGTIAHTRDSATEIFDKVRFAYDNLPEPIKEALPATQDSAQAMSFGNGSKLVVGTSLRSGTYQYLHISELGYTCAHFPEKAEEIRNGALNTVHAGNITFIESTAKGRIGLFYEVATKAQKKRGELGPLDFKLHFYPWWKHPNYRLDEPYRGELPEYFEGLERAGIDLTDGQKAWYIAKVGTQGAKMRSEYPSTEDEAFEAASGVFFDCFDRAAHVVDPFKLPEHWLRFRAMDWGSARPFSIGWWAVASETVQTRDRKHIIPKGALIKYREWYGCKKDEAGDSIPNVGVKLTAEEVGRGIAARQDKGEARYCVADPAMWTEDGGPSLAERVAKAAGEGAGIWRRADNARVARKGHLGGWDQLRDRMLGEDIGQGVRPMFYLFSTCDDTIRTIPAVFHDEKNPEDLDTNAEDHALDEARYAAMSRPYTRPAPAADKPMLNMQTGLTLNQLWERGRAA